jgi:NAD(P)-dependent dehydrogenase (short-subunit alcohol dehydrogenase family)
LPDVRLDGIGAMVTGGASGLGAATARTLADAGAGVTIVDLSPRGEQVAAEVGGTFVAADVSDGPAMEAAFAAGAVAHGPTRLLVCCAGVGAARAIVRRSGPHDLDEWDRVIRVNLTGTFNCIRLAAAGMVALDPLDDGERGVIVTTSSIAAFDGVDGGVAYSASKAGVAGMTLPLARDLGDAGVRVMSIAPGVFETPLVDGLPPSYMDDLRSKVPHPGRLGRPEEFAALVAHIAANPMLNGSVIRLDGALRMTPSKQYR